VIIPQRQLRPDVLSESHRPILFWANRYR